MFEGVRGFIETLERVSIVFLVAVVVALSVFLFATPTVSDALGFSKLREDIRPYVGTVWLLTVSLLVARIFASVVSLSKRSLAKRNQKKQLLKSLETLTPEEKGYLTPYIFEKKTAIQAGLDDGIMGTLVAKKICYRASAMFDALEGMPFSLQPWARSELEKSPELLDGAIGKPLTPRERLYGEGW